MKERASLRLRVLEPHSPSPGPHWLGRLVRLGDGGGGGHREACLHREPGYGERGWVRLAFGAKPLVRAASKGTPSATWGLPLDISGFSVHPLSAINYEQDLTICVNLGAHRIHTRAASGAHSGAQ